MAPVRSRTWCFTVNNWSSLEFTGIVTNLERVEAKYVIGKEVGEQGTPHLQGYCRFGSARTLASAKRLLGERAHLEPAKGSDKQNVVYCTKEADYELSPDFTKYVPIHIKARKLLRADYDGVEWKPWQARCLEIVNSKPDDRKIHWFWDENGNTGKSYLSKYIYLAKQGVIVANGKVADVFHQVNTMMNPKKGNGTIPRIVILDVPRTSMEYFNYAAIEKLKDGFFYSGKYEGGVCVFPKPILVCFANSEPAREKLSQDRWDIHHIGSGLGGLDPRSRGGTSSSSG